MAKRDEQQRKLELLEQLSRQRAQITSQRGKLVTQIANTTEEIKDKINVPKRLKDGIKNNIRSSFSASPTKWFLGSAVGGLLVTKILFGRKKIYSKVNSVSGSTSVPRGILTTSLLYFGKPYLKRFLFKKGRTMLLRRFIPIQHQAEEAQYSEY